uniref:Uncharacterized protein n=1 Tax=Arundo donax TaxID=35708 RepID=A0A0A8Y769_ARUDO
MTNDNTYMIQAVTNVTLL